jgi:hypothetical protein
MARLQGIQLSAINLEGITASQLGAAIGNAMSVNVLKSLLPRCLYMARLINRDTLREAEGKWLRKA